MLENSNFPCISQPITTNHAYDIRSEYDKRQTFYTNYNWNLCKTFLNWQCIQIKSDSSLSTRKIEITKIRILITWMCESFSISMSRTNDTHDKRSNWRIISCNIGYFRKQFNKHNLVLLHRQIPSFHTQQQKNNITQ